MANPLLPAGRTRPLAAYIAARTLPPFNLVNRTTFVDASTRTRQPNANAGGGVGSALLGGSVTIKNVGKL